MRYFKLLTVIISFSLPLATEAENLLEQSFLLKKHNIKIIPAEIEGDKVYFELDEDEKNKPIYLLSDSGVAQLSTYKKNTNSSDNFYRSGIMANSEALVADIPSSNQKISSTSFIAIGTNADKYIKYSAAKELSKCPDNKIASKIYSPDGRELTLTSKKCFSDFKLITYFSKWSAPESSIKSGCDDFYFDESGYITDSGSHYPFKRSFKDCNGKSLSLNTPFVEELVGSISVDNGKEIWLIFNSNNYESHGYTILRIISRDRPEVLQHKEVHYWGS